MENNNGQNSSILPPLPPSDEQSISWNRLDGFYGVRSRDFWGKNQVVSHKVEDYKKCNHYFIQTGPSVECKTCHIGFYGYFEIQEGKLYKNGEPIGI